MRTYPTQHAVLTQHELQQLLEKAAEEGARRALASVGLHDDRAAGDLRDLRELLENWRDARRAVLRTVAQIVTAGVLALIAAGLAVQLWTKGVK